MTELQKAATSPEEWGKGKEVGITRLEECGAKAYRP